MKIHNMPQGTPEWFAIRKGKITASHAQAIGNVGKGLETYTIETMAEFFSSAEGESYSNKDIERGKELEEVARQMYELENGSSVSEVGFIEFDEQVGVSPDGMVGEDGLVEIKCLNDINHFKHILYGEASIDSGHIWQMQMQMLVSCRKWCDYVLYNPNYKKSLLVFRIMADEEKHKSLLKGFEVAKVRMEEIKAIVDKI